MKKLLFAAVLGLSFTANSQSISKNALGLRIGDNDGFGYEVSYQRKMQRDNRLEIDLGLRNNNNLNFLKATGIYQWVWQIEGDFNWYAGVGGGFGSFSYNDNFKKNNSNFSNSGGTYVFAAGNIGIEYDFDIPLMISLDFRPEFVVSNRYGDSFGRDIALSLRYQF